MVRDLLIRAITATTPIDSKKIDSLTGLIKNTEQYKQFEAKNSKKGKVSFKIRYTLGGDGLAYKITWLVDDKEKGYSSGGIKYDQLHKFVTEGGGQYQRHQCKACGSWSKGEKIKSDKVIA